MRSLRDRLKYVANTQGIVNDGCRLFSDGKILIRTPTENGGEGWMEIASRISGASVMFGHFFDRSDEAFLKVGDLRAAIEMRDLVMVEVTQERTLKTMKSMVRKEVLKKARTKAVRILPIKSKEKKEKKDRKPTTVFL